jgi:hypothetical protein
MLGIVINRQPFLEAAIPKLKITFSQAFTTEAHAQENKKNPGYLHIVSHYFQNICFILTLSHIGFKKALYNQKSTSYQFLSVFGFLAYFDR